MNGFACASLPRFLRNVSFLMFSILMACAIPLHAAAPDRTVFSKAAVPEGLRDAVHQTLGDQWNQTQEVSQTDPAFDPEFGYAVALHGTTAMIGAQQAQIGANEDQGAVYVYQQGGNGTWSLTQTLVASDGQAFDTFGHSIVFEGDTAFIGAYGAMINGNFSQGAVYVFTLSNGTWSETQKLTADDGQMFDNFGYSLGLSGTTALIGADGATVGNNGFQGAVYVFNESGGTWTQGQKLVASDGGIGDIFGYSIVFDGMNAMVGAYANNQYQGAVYVFGDSGGTFTESQKLVADDGTSNSYFGYATALSGSTLLVGAWGASPNGTDTQGEAYIFTESNGTWSQTQQLFADDGGVQDKFGHSVALDGTHALIGADGVDSATGAVYAFDGTGGVWTQAQKFYASDGAPSFQFGLPVTLDGNTALVGSWLWMSPESQMDGAAYFFEFGPPPVTYTIGGTVSGLTGSGLVLQQNGGDDLPISADGAFTFATPVNDGSAYSVTVAVQPGNPMQTCIVKNGSGTVQGADVTGVQVICSTTPPPTYTIGGSVSGLAGSGLVLQQNGGDDLPISANSAFTFATPVDDGASYSVTVSAQPTNPAQTCVVANGSGTVNGANVDNVDVTCTTDVTDRIFADGFDGSGAGGGSAALAETTDMTPVAQNSVACGHSSDGTTADNQYWRRYYFSDYQLTSAVDVSSVDVSVEQTTGAPNMTVTLYTTPHSVTVDTIDLSQLTQIGQATVAAPANAALTSINVPVSGTVADTVGTDLVVEVSTDDGSADGTAFYIGSTTSAETHPSFLSSAACSLSDPTPTSDIGYPDMHIIQAVNVTY